jgi:hypothetical protein
VAEVEEIFETGTEQVDDEDVVKAFLAKVIDIRNTGCRYTVSAQYFSILHHGNGRSDLIFSRSHMAVSQLRVRPFFCGNGPNTFA